MRRTLRFIFVTMILLLTNGVCWAQQKEALRTMVQQAEEALSRAFELGPVIGKFAERTPGSYVFSPSNRGLPIASVANPDQVSAGAVGPELRVVGRYDREIGQVRVTGYWINTNIPPMARIESSTPTPEAFLGDRSSTEIAASIIADLNSAGRPGAQSVETRTLDNQSEVGRKTLGNVADFSRAYLEAVEQGNESKRLEIVRNWIEVRGAIANFFTDAPDLKALYGRIDNYETWRYGRIFEDSAAVVAIADPDQDRAICSGVLVAEDLVLTAGHCFKKEPNRYEIWFGYAERPDDGQTEKKIREISATPVAPPPNRWQEVLNENFSQDLYDYAIIRLKKPDGEPLLPQIEIEPGRFVTPKPQCLRKLAPDRGSPLYVVGYPESRPATVHDNGLVEYPFKVLDGEKFGILRMEVEADFLNTDDHLEVLDELDRSYLLSDSDGSFIKWRKFFDVREKGQPRMGIVADTFKGNSGGPVFERRGNQCVVGVFIAGMQDTGERRIASWKVHERVLPIEALIEDLDKNPDTHELIDNSLDIQ